MFPLLLLAWVAGAYEYPNYCSKVGDEDFVQARTIPELSQEAVRLKTELVHVSTILRHGARTPAGRYLCWRGYAPQWNCDVEESLRPLLTARAFAHTRTEITDLIPPVPGDADIKAAGASDAQVADTEAHDLDLFPETATPQLMFRKHYDSDPAANSLGGTCGKGHLLAEGFEQHAHIGQLFAQYYQKNSTPLIATDAKNQIWFRSSDMQRTILSGATFLTHFIRASNLTVGGEIDLHTMDEGNDFIFPNAHACPELQQLKEDLLSSQTFAELQAKYEGVEKSIAVLTGLEDVKALWPGEFFDCIMTAVCGDEWASLPSNLRPMWLSSEVDTSDAASNQQIGSNLAGNNQMGTNQAASMRWSDAFHETVGKTSAAVNEYASYQYTWNGSRYSRAATVKFMVEFKTELCRALMKHVTADHEPAQAARILADIIPTDDLQEFYRRVVASRTSITTPFDAKKLVVYAAHDTTLLPFLASLGNEDMFDATWPPYASQMIFELHAATKDTPHLRDQPDDDDQSDDVDNQTAYFFRLIYNGVSITDRIPACSKRRVGTSDLCGLKAFFHATSWAAPSKVTALCGSPTVIPDVVY
ncbi:histidine phosphatase superfamily (branch 2) protein [Gregarina niphandrodes]|uniref:Histidine phosphatase superfamily (Branch 2) protein n=1 Tax=Gregarina niphandrodes TaxID=110365 RepID=A0A023BDT6_GRENI|nr:histidine phosphatase superfamily (branch 2) protein [Gregarina niphandrodes]EZG89693.1 histidine phosphatase superfamily (branch 2) protein [Gregarina niphandrodes]|eukprot:XP_011128458.1 histidine phosphatase superfamily (branch 2) protein [Gregarina niphandrodes]